MSLLVVVHDENAGNALLIGTLAVSQTACSRFDRNASNFFFLRQPLPFNMNLAIIILSLFAVAGAVNEKPSLVKGHSRKIDADDADSVASMHQLVVGARNLDITIGRRLSSPLDKVCVDGFFTSNQIECLP